MPAAFIPDGYTISGRIQSDLYDDVKITWRQCNHEKRQAIQAGIHKADRNAQAITDAAARAISAFLVSWDLVHPESGAPIDLTVANIKKAHPDLVEELLSIVLGIRAPTEFLDPSHASQEADEQFSAAVGGEGQDNAGN